VNSRYTTRGHDPIRLYWHNLWLGLLFAIACVAASAVENQTAISRFAHTSWGQRDGAPRSVFAIAQSRDGYLWLGAGDGLFRFDGVTFERYETQSGPTLPTGSSVTNLVALPNGDLWIGYYSGAVARLRNGRAHNYMNFAGLPSGKMWISCLTRDEDGTMWVGKSLGWDEPGKREVGPPGGLARLVGDRWQQVGPDWNFPAHSVNALYVDHDGTLWVAGEGKIFFLPHGSRKFQATSINAGPVWQITEAPDRQLWMNDTSESVRPVGLDERHPPSEESRFRVIAEGMTFDHDRNLWIVTFDKGIRFVPAHEGADGKPVWSNRSVESFTAKDGLTDDSPITVFQDREQNIWVGTASGLDRFRERSIVPVDLPAPSRDVILIPDNLGAIWSMRGSQIFHLGQSHIDEIQNPNHSAILWGCRDSANVLWLIYGKSLLRLDHGKASEFPLPWEPTLPPPDTVSATVDGYGKLWVAAQGKGLFYRENAAWKQFGGHPELSSLAPNTAFTDAHGSAWFGYADGTTIRLNGGELRTISSPQSSLVIGVLSIGGRNGHVWIGGEGGLEYFDGDRLRAVQPADRPSFTEIAGIAELADGSLWICEWDTILRIDGEEVRKFLTTPSYRVHYQVFDSSDGLPGSFQNAGQKLIEGSDGRLWFGTITSLIWLKPTDSPEPAPAPISIDSVIADGKRFVPSANFTLPSRTTDIQIDYAALNFTAPEKVRYRYRMEGIDKRWQDAGIRREAFYTNLGPGKYTFHVSSHNQGGEWNPADAVLEFTIAPAWFQTAWFQALCLCFGLFLLLMLYRLRLRQLEHQFSNTLQTRVDERTRIARELHDTLLQSFQGLTLHFQRARNLLPDRAAEAIETLDTALDGAEEAIVEGRDAIHDLRSPTGAARALAEEITALGEELVAKSANKSEPLEFRIVIEGSASAMHPNQHIEVFRIAREALRNAFSHSQGHLIETELAYTSSLFRLRIRDDGKGIDHEERVIAERTGHWGLKGMRERAERLGGELEVWSEPGAGTEIELRVPAAIAYESVLSHDSFWRFWRRKRNP
jgi:signal transduction histidine kinase/ligand-binding sensor domain-containing protein